MTVLKRGIAFFISLTICFCMIGCKSNTEQMNDNSKYKLTIMTTLFPYYDFVRAIVGNNSGIQVKLLVSPGQDDHSFEPTPSDIIQIDNADVFIYNGGSIETWVEEVVSSLNNKSQIQIKMMDYIDLENHDDDAQGHQDENIYAEHQHDHAEEEHNHSGDEEEHEEVDEHIWTSPVYAMIFVQEICNKLCEIMPEREDQFKENALNYIKKIEAVDEQFREIVKVAKHKEIIFADKFP